MTEVLQKVEDEIAQLKAAFRIQFAWGCRMRIMPRTSMYDFEFYRSGAVSAIGEYKRRRFLRTNFATFFVSYDKFLWLRREAVDRGITGLIFVEWDKDDLRYIDVVDVREDGAIKVGGREPRPGAPNDEEAVIHIPVGKFVRIKREDEVLREMKKARG